MKSLKTLLFCGCVLLLAAFSFSSCEGESNIKLMKNGSVSFEFEGNVGGTFKEMIGEEAYIDSESVKNDLVSSGFSNVKVSVVQDFIKISFTDDEKMSPLFSLGIFSIKNNNELIISLTPENFLELYNECGEDLQMIFDIFMSPVLNEEVMSEEDYVDTISVAYGEAAGSEIDKSVVRFNITNADGTSKKRSVYVKNILCGGKIYF